MAVKTVTEDEIIAAWCPTCHARPGQGCRDKNRHTLVERIGQIGLSFHQPRVMVAHLGPTEKALIIYYAFIMLCDSVSINSETVLGKWHTSEEIQTFFGKMALNELKKEGLIK